MINQSYFPKSEASRVVWLSNFVTKLQIHATVLKLDAAEVTSTVADVNYYIWVVQNWYPSIQQSAFEATAFKNIIATGPTAPICALPLHQGITPPSPTPVPGVLNRVFNLIARIKIGASYTDSIGLDLGIVGGYDTKEHVTPDYSVTTERGAQIEQASISFTKFGHDGVSIEGRRNQGEWGFLAIAMLKPWLDTRPLLDPHLPEIREYRLRWWDKGDANGEHTAVQRVTVGP